MAREIEFGSRTVADDYREEPPEYVASGDDRRRKTVTFVEDLPDWLLDCVTADAASSRDERISDAGQVPLSDDGRSRIDFSNDQTPFCIYENGCIGSTELPK